MDGVGADLAEYAMTRRDAILLVNTLSAATLLAVAWSAAVAWWVSLG
jgi:hypothetical protein